MKPTGRSASISRASSWSRAAKPRGLSRSEAILARNLLTDSPTDTVIPMSRSTSRAEGKRLEHRHRRAHPKGAGNIAGSRNHAALAAADDDGLVGEIRIVALLD